jgi:anti-sigma factor ChrR (cupin superfamily)
MNCDAVQQLTALEALGALDGPEGEQLRARLRQDPATRVELARFLDVTAGLASSAIASRPSPSLRTRILEEISQRPQQTRTAPAESISPPAPPPGIQFHTADAPWLPAPTPGARFKLLSAGPHQGYIMMLIELAPGGGYPEHEHVGVEDMYVLTGDLQTEGRSLGPGDSLHAEPGSHHRALHSVGGCTAIMVVPNAALESLRPA